MSKKISENFSMRGWNIWQFIKGRKKLIITIVSMICIKFAFDPELVGLLAGGAVFEGIWSLFEYYFKRLEIK